jgi:hypothetical protein
MTWLGQGAGFMDSNVPLNAWDNKKETSVIVERLAPA